MKFVSFFQKPTLPTRLFRVIVFVLCVIVLFLIAFRAPGDPDFGWHLRTGQEILARHAIPYTDWFSHTLPNFQWIDHEYASNVLIALLTRAFGVMGPSVFYALLLSVILLFLVGETTIKKVPFSLRAIYGLLLFPVFVSFIGVRPQEVTWLFVTLILAIVAHMKRNQKSRLYLFLPPIFLFWTNLHGGSVAIGAVLLGIILGIEGLKVWYFHGGEENIFLQKKYTLSLISYIKITATTLVSLVATLVNPYGYRIYVELVRTITDSYSTGIIREWLSPNFKDYTGLVFLLAIFVMVQVLYLQYKKKVDFTNFVLFLAFFFLATQSVRHIPLFMLVVSPFLLDSFVPPFKKYVEPILQKVFVFLPAVVVFVVLIVRGIPVADQFHLTLNPEAMAYNGNYPFAAVEYIKGHHLKGEMFNDYNWGGYLIQNLPDHKVFIDGRMPHWRTNDLHLFREYNSILNIESGFEQKLSSYHVGFVLVPSSSIFATFLETKESWQEVFRDSTAVIFVNKEAQK